MPLREIFGPTCQTGVSVRRFEMPVRGGHERPWRVECWVSDDRRSIIPIEIITPNITRGLPPILVDDMPSRGSGFVIEASVPMTYHRAMEVRAAYLATYPVRAVLTRWEETVGAEISRAFLQGRGQMRPEPEAAPLLLR